MIPFSQRGRIEVSPEGVSCRHPPHVESDPTCPSWPMPCNVMGSLTTLAGRVRAAADDALRAPSSNISGSAPTCPPGQMVQTGLFANTFRRPFDASADARAGSVRTARRACRRRAARVSVGARRGSPRAAGTFALARARSVLMYVHAAVSSSLRRSSAAPVKWSRACSPRTHVSGVEGGEDRDVGLHRS